MYNSLLTKKTEIVDRLDRLIFSLAEFLLFKICFLPS